MSKANLPYAISVCSLLNSICRKYGYFVALTGGCLYNQGERKDIDVLFYVNRNMSPKPDRDALLQEISTLFEHGVHKVDYYDRDFDGYVYQTKWNGIRVDMLFPDTPLRQCVHEHKRKQSLGQRLFGWSY